MPTPESEKNPMEIAINKMEARMKKESDLWMKNPKTLPKDSSKIVK
jgi:hypothetical protein